MSVIDHKRNINQRSTLLKTTDNIYYNIKLFNPPNTQNQDRKIIPCVYSENRTDVILSDPSNYEVSVVRFSIPTEDIPIFIYPQDELGFSNLRVVYREITSNTIVEYDIVYTDYTPGLTPERSIWTYQQFVDFINLALDEGYTNFLEILSNLPVPIIPIQTDPPILTYDPVTQYFSMNFPLNWDSNDSPILVGFSENLYTRFFNGLQTFDIGESSTNKSFIYYLFCNYLLNNIVSYDGVDYVNMIQEYKSIELWSDVQSINFETDTIPVKQEYQPGTKSVTRRILTDFEPIMSEYNRSNYQFFPQGPLRWYDMESSYPLKSIDVKVFWESKSGNIYPVNLFPDQIFTLKLRFRKKQKKNKYLTNYMDDELEI